MTNLKIIILPMVLGFFITCLLNPMVMIFQRWKIPRLIAIVLTLFLGMCVIWIAVNFIVVNILAFRDGLPAYKDKFDILVSNILEFRNQRFEFLTLDMIKEQARSLSLGSVVTGFVNYLFSFTGYFLLTLLFILYFLPALRTFPDKLKKAFPGEKGITLCNAVDTISQRVQSYILVKALVSIGLGLAYTIICKLFGVDFSATWGIFTFFLNFIPTVGIIISTLLPVLLCLLQYSWTAALWLTISLGIPAAITLNFIEPMFLGRSVNLSPVTALMAIFFWGWLWGGVGMIIAVPATAVIKLTCDNFKGLKPLGALMGTTS
ncbi:MAG: AI-2E family transporter [Deltaproteobacteria bacterium]|nr:AI-2E family transporter [Deltaproteobacteria bacterium]